MRSSLTIIGAGRVGRSLGRALRESGWKICGVVARTKPAARRAVRFIGQGHPFVGISGRALAPRTILIAVQDSELPSLVSEVARMCTEDWKGKVLIHTSGALASDVFSPLRALGASVGSMHPMQTFSGIGVPPLEGRVFAIEGDVAAMRTARQFARTLGGYVLQLPVKGKAAYHAAASMAAGQVLAVIEAATNLMMSIGVKRREAVRALLPLSRQVLDNFERVGPGAAWTGPLARGDFEVVASHETALRDFPPEYLGAYRRLNRLAARVLSQNPEQTISKLEELEAGSRVLAKTTGRQG
ncbi:MAG TPA: DUF2520 domain-containing protein [Candidatus Acidoferrum sp.]|nr:DUF2520 domain-containing protein [Candidatus Acidoferrum sp.]